MFFLFYSSFYLFCAVVCLHTTVYTVSISSELLAQAITLKIKKISALLLALINYVLRVSKNAQLPVLLKQWQEGTLMYNLVHFILDSPEEYIVRPARTASKFAACLRCDFFYRQTQCLACDACYPCAAVSRS